MRNFNDPSVNSRMHGPRFLCISGFEMTVTVHEVFLTIFSYQICCKEKEQRELTHLFQRTPVFPLLSFKSTRKIICMGGGPEKEVYFLLISIHFQNVAQVFLFLPITWGLTTTNSLALASVITPFIMLQISITSCNSCPRSNDGILRFPARKARAEVNGSALIMGSVASTLGRPFSPV